MIPTPTASSRPQRSAVERPAARTTTTAREAHP